MASPATGLLRALLLAAAATLARQQPEGAEAICAWHRPIDVRESLTYAEFVNEYKNPGIPVVIRQYAPLVASRRAFLDALGTDSCSTQQLDFFSSRLAAFLPTLSAAARAEMEAALIKSHGLGLAEVQDMMQRGMTLGEMLEYLRSESQRHASGARAYSGVSTYVLPLDLHDTKLSDICVSAMVDLLVPKYVQVPHGDLVLLGQSGSIALGASCLDQTLLDPNLFLASANSRAYPAHVHRGFHNNILLIMSGAKHLVHWDFADRHLLYRNNETHKGGPELLYEAEGFRPDLAAQPSLAAATAYSGVAEAGDLLFVPCGGVHAVENVGEEPAIAVRYMMEDTQSLSCMARVEAAVEQAGNDEVERGYFDFHWRDMVARYEQGVGLTRLSEDERGALGGLGAFLGPAPVSKDHGAELRDLDFFSFANSACPELLS